MMTQSAPTTDTDMQLYTLDPEYHWDNLSFTVGLTRFRLRANRFLEGSEFFVEKYEVKKILSEGVETRIELRDVDLADFRAFLKALEPADRSGNVDLSKDGWISVLKLSTMWFFRDLRKMAIAALEALNMDPVESVYLAKQYNISAWLLSAYSALVMRADTITVEEATRMDEGKETALRLYGIIVCGLRKNFAGRKLKKSTGVTESGVLQEIRDVFAEELARARLVEQEHLTDAEKRICDEERLKAEALAEEMANRRAAAAAKEQQEREQRASAEREAIAWEEKVKNAQEAREKADCEAARCARTEMEVREAKEKAEKEMEKRKARELEEAEAKAKAKAEAEAKAEMEMAMAEAEARARAAFEGGWGLFKKA